MKIWMKLALIILAGIVTALIIFIPDNPKGPDSTVAPPPQDMSTVTWITEAWPNFTQEDGIGVYHDLINAIFSSQGIEVEVVYAPWARCLEMVKNGSYNMTGGISPSEQYYQSQYPVFEYIDLIVFKKGTMVWEGMESLTDKSGVWVRGYLMEEADREVMEYIKGDELPTFTAAINFLHHERADYLLMGLEGLENFSDQIEDFNLDDYEMIRLKSGQLYFSFTRDEEGVHWRDLYDRGVEAIGQEAINEIYEKWDLTPPSLDL